MFTALIQSFSLKSEAVILPEDFYMRVCNISEVIDTEGCETAEIELLQTLNDGRNSVYTSTAMNCSTWMYSMGLSIFNIVERKRLGLGGVLTPIKEINLVNDVLSKCKLEFNSVLNRVQELDFDLYQQLLFLFCYESKGRPLTSTFFKQLRNISTEINLIDFQVSKTLINSRGHTWIELYEWELISGLNEHFSDLIYLLRNSRELVSK